MADYTKIPKIFFTSDLHYGHINICLGTSKWDDKDKCRKFHSIAEMNEAIIKSINSVVGEDDILYHLGDWSFGGWENIWVLRKQIVCKNIIQINGNHDEQIMKDKFFPHLEKQGDVIYEIEKPRIWQGYKTDGDVTATDFFKEVHNMLYLKIDKQFIVLSHEPFEVWRNKDKGAIHLHGHLHHEMDNSYISKNFKRKDVGWNGEVYLLDNIINEMTNKEHGFHH